jgi:hypothetical protein
MNYSITQTGKPLDPSLYTIDEETKIFSCEEDNLVLDFCGLDGWTFNVGNSCTFKTGSRCTFKTGDSCTFNTGSHCTFNTGSHCIFKTCNSCTLLYSTYKVFRAFLDEGYFVINDADGYIPEGIEKLKFAKPFKGLEGKN